MMGHVDHGSVEEFGELADVMRSAGEMKGDSQSGWFGECREHRGHLSRVEKRSHQLVPTRMKWATDSSA
jgi:hypothetical protein